HGTCGVWGILACALFDTTGGGYTIIGQLTGVVAVAAAAFAFSLVVFGLLKATIGIRVSSEEETEGLDVGEHGMEAYPHFQTARENRSEEHTSELQSRENLVCRLLLEKKNS